MCNFASLLINRVAMSTTYFRLEGSTGLIYVNSKDPKEGHEKKESKNPQTGQTVISYRKYHKEGMFGRLQYMYLKENKFSGRTVLSICIGVVDGEDRYQLEIPYEDQKGNIGSFAESFISYMPQLEKDKPYRVFPYVLEDKDNLDANGKPRKKYGVSVSVARLSDRAVDKDNKIPRLLSSYVSRETKQLVKRDIPAIVYKENHKGTKTADKTDSNAYLHKVMEEYSIHFSGSGGAVRTFNSKEETSPEPQSTQQAQPENVTTAKAIVATADGDDDLPF